MQDFDQTFYKFSGDDTPDPRGGRGHPLPHSSQSQHMLSDPNILRSATIAHTVWKTAFIYLFIMKVVQKYTLKNKQKKIKATSLEHTQVINNYIACV